MKIYRIVAVILLVFSITTHAYSPSTTGFQFLRTQVGARPAGMAGAFVAVPGDVNSLYYNPASIAVIGKRTASFTYLNDLLDFNSGFIGYVHPRMGLGNFGFSVLYKDYGQFDKMDQYGQEMGTFGANSISLNASYAITAAENLYIGATGKYIRASIENYSADAVALDAGVMYVMPKHELTFAAGIYNLGTATSAFVETKDDLPLCLRAGFSKKLAHLPLLLSANAYKYSDEAWQAAIGGEFTLSDYVLLRLGYDFIGRKMHVDASDDTFAGAAIGLGFLWKQIKIDYSYTSYGVLGSLNRFTISSHF
ncbi:PorV/PorQ family protein [candidate division KSB1 bacterium]|nr:PorV/PorQ family protein [candidate division KSB1 bacterium]